MWSPGAERLFGYASEEAIGQTLDLIVPARHRERHWSGFRSAMGTGRAKSEGGAANIPVVCRDKSERRFPGRFILLRDALGAVIGAMAIFAPAAENAPLYNL